MDFLIFLWFSYGLSYGFCCSPTSHLNLRPDLNQAPKSPTGEAMLQSDGGVATDCETDCSFAYLQQGESSAWEDWEDWEERSEVG